MLVIKIILMILIGIAIFSMAIVLFTSEPNLENEE